MPNKLLIVALFGLVSVPSIYSKKDIRTNALASAAPSANFPAVKKKDIDFWLTKGDQTSLLQKQTNVLRFGTTANSYVNITVDTRQRFQTVDGFGFTLTSGSATLINNLGAGKAALLEELFGRTANSIGISYLRISIGASDLSANVYTYDDMPSCRTDPTLKNCTLDAECAAGTCLIPI